MTLVLSRNEWLECSVLVARSCAASVVSAVPVPSECRVLGQRSRDAPRQSAHARPIPFFRMPRDVRSCTTHILIHDYPLYRV